MTTVGRNFFTAERRIGTRLLWIALCGSILLARKLDVAIHPQLWAEDGAEYYRSAMTLGAASFLRPIAGYFAFLPRLIAWIASKCDPSWVPAIFVYGAFAITLLVISRVFSSRLHFGSKPCLALAIVAVPHTGEVYLNPTNVQWITALALVLTLLMVDPVTIGEWLMDAGTLLVAGFTGPYAVFVAPLFFLRAIRRKTAASWILAGGLGLVSAVQAWVIVFHSTAARPLSYGPEWLFNLLAVLSDALPLALFGGRYWAGNLSRTFAVVVGVAIVALIGWIALPRRPDRLFGRRLAVGGFVLVLLGFTLAKIRADTWVHGCLPDADRYFFIPKLLLLWLVIASMRADPARRYVASAFLILAAVCALPEFRCQSLRHYDWSLYCGRIRAGQMVTVTTPPGWSFDLPARANH